MEEFDGRVFSEETIDWHSVCCGDVVIEGDVYTPSMYRTLTQVDGKNWEYFGGGYYCSTSPEFCHWLVRGQKRTDEGKLIRIIYRD